MAGVLLALHTSAADADTPWLRVNLRVDHIAERASTPARSIGDGRTVLQIMELVVLFGRAGGVGLLFVERRKLDLVRSQTVVHR